MIKTKLHSKILFILISIKVLDLYILHADANDKFSLNLHDINKLPNITTILIYIIKKNYHITHVITYLIDNYHINSASNLMLNYLTKFQYLAYQSQKYYMNASLQYPVNIQEIAIRNLGVLYLIYKYNNWYTLIQYLFQEDNLSKL